jgi:GNAT superfamily N-acetyltransferase
MTETLRRADRRDALVLPEIFLGAFRAALPHVRLAHDDADCRRHFGGPIIDEHETWVAVGRDGVAVAFLTFGGDVVDVGGVVDADGVGDAAGAQRGVAARWVDQLYVRVGAQRNGAGTALLRHAQQRSPGGIDLWTFQANAGARRFYEGGGFVAVAMTDGDNEEGEPDVRYRWRAPRP